jgi:hypothetical protein
MLMFTLKHISRYSHNRPNLDGPHVYHASYLHTLNQETLIKQYPVIYRHWCPSKMVVYSAHLFIFKESPGYSDLHVIHCLCYPPPSLADTGCQVSYIVRPKMVSTCCVSIRVRATSYFIPPTLKMIVAVFPAQTDFIVVC